MQDVINNTYMEKLKALMTEEDNLYIITNVRAHQHNKSIDQ
jgi:hypothetical protein